MEVAGKNVFIDRCVPFSLGQTLSFVAWNVSIETKCLWAVAWRRCVVVDDNTLTFGTTIPDLVEVAKLMKGKVSPISLCCHNPAGPFPSLPVISDKRFISKPVRRFRKCFYSTTFHTKLKCNLTLYNMINVAHSVTFGQPSKQLGDLFGIIGTSNSDGTGSYGLWRNITKLIARSRAELCISGTIQHQIATARSGIPLHTAFDVYVWMDGFFVFIYFRTQCCLPIFEERFTIVWHYFGILCSGRIPIFRAHLEAGLDIPEFGWWFCGFLVYIWFACLQRTTKTTKGRSSLRQ